MIQRCAVCGDKLLDVDLNGEDNHIAYQDGTLLRFRRGNQIKNMGEYMRFDSVPSDFCIVLVERP